MELECDLWKECDLWNYGIGGTWALGVGGGEDQEDCDPFFHPGPVFGVVGFLVFCVCVGLGLGFWGLGLWAQGSGFRV